ncbi:Iron-sulfur-binding reductase [Mesoflavibacter sp. HG96]|uniref:(Fe-S)-binding protein n=1 Tax=Mesoflavibacter TaxID=444051 RepID=UPI000D10EEF5|nr:MULTISPECIES: (Fe-S)-binding protein [Mesoflavibacter]QIJ90213.1 Iron-sulfur-binding reductase [Mesoflavibacter sp. HG96]QIJ92941.1 Iron-sulfur-binding reductase [Mesoflavibacter sp. HG37]
MSDQLIVPVMADVIAQGKQPEYLYWVGSAGAFDDRAKKITKAFVRLLNKANVDFAVLGTEESASGDAAKRAGNEFLFQMQAMTNIEVMNMYEVKKIITTDPHDYNTLKNEYPGLGGKYEVYHHTEFLSQLISQGKLKIQESTFKGKKVTFHDPCYLGRANEVYQAPRDLIKELGVSFTEMKRNQRNSLCCGAGGAQMFKEPEKGDKDINVLRTEDALETNPKVIITACPFCNTMMTDGVKAKEKEADIEVLDIAEMLSNTQ